MPDETPLQRLRRLEAQEKSGAAPGGKNTGKAAAAGGGALLALTQGKTAFLLLLGKFKFLILAAKLLPLLGTAATMAVSIQVYSAEFGWSLAAGLVALILLHELGHGAVAKRLGLRVGAPVFIPFFGAVIALKDQPRSSWVECLVGAGGPAAGLLGAAACAAAAVLDPAHGGYLLALVHLTAAINLFNLLPAAGLDGDRITQPFARAHWRAVLTVLAALCAAASAAAGRLDALTFMILLAAAVKAWRRRGAAPARLLDKLEEAGRYAAEEAVTPQRRRAAAGLYLGLACALAALTAWAGRPRPNPSAPNLIGLRPVRRLYLMRHGHSPTPADAGVKTDALRPLSDQGRRDARRMAEEIARRGGRPTLVLHSPLLRAAQTAQAAAEALKTAVQVLKALDNSLPADEALARLRAGAGAADELLAVGHQPQIGEIATLLTDEVFEIRPAGLVAVELEPTPRLLWSLNADELG